MSLTLPKTCSMGASKTGLVGTIGVTLLNPDGTTKTARVTAGIYEIGGGDYGVQIVFDDNWSGVISWDTGGGTPVYATEEYNIEGLIDATLEDTNELQVDWVNGGRLDLLLDAIPATGAIADAVLDEVFEGTYTLRQFLRGAISILAGLSGGGGTTTLNFRDVADLKNRITATVDINGNRTAITLDLT